MPLPHCLPHKDTKHSFLQRPDPSRSTAPLKRKLLFHGGRQAGGGIHIYKATSKNTLTVKYRIASSELLPIHRTKGDRLMFLHQRGSVKQIHVCNSGIPKCTPAWKYHLVSVQEGHIAALPVPNARSFMVP